MSETQFTRDAVKQLSAKLNEPQWMLDFRLKAFEFYQDIPWPTLKDEAWRRTDIRPLKLEAIGPSLNGAGQSPVDFTPPTLGQETSGTLLQVDGETKRYQLSEKLKEQGVIFAPMSMAVREHEDLLHRLFMTEAVHPADGKFAALHAAFWRGGTFLYVPARVELSAPLHSILWGTAGKTFSHTLVVLEPNSKATLVNELASAGGEGQALHNGVIELLVRDGAHLEYIGLQDWGRDVWQFTHERAIVGRAASLDWVVSALGSRLTKSFQTVELDGQGAKARVSGLFFAHRNQHIDLDTQQNHKRPDTTSDLLYKGALKDQSRSVWQGMIKVLPDAQRTNGYQANRNLILAKTARADSIPGLEIEANDVRCTHGATVGQVDGKEVFYLMSRGLPRAEAVRLVVGGFFAPVLERIPVPSVRERLAAAIQDRV